MQNRSLFRYARTFRSACESLVAFGTSRTSKNSAIGTHSLPLANGGPTLRVFRTGNSRLTGRADLDRPSYAALPRRSASVR